LCSRNGSDLYSSTSSSGSEIRREERFFISKQVWFPTKAGQRRQQQKTAAQEELRQRMQLQRGGRRLGSITKVVQSGAAREWQITEATKSDRMDRNVDSNWSSAVEGVPPLNLSSRDNELLLQQGSPTGTATSQAETEDVCQEAQDSIPNPTWPPRPQPQAWGIACPANMFPSTFSSSNLSVRDVGGLASLRNSRVHARIHTHCMCVCVCVCVCVRACVCIYVYTAVSE